MSDRLPWFRTAERIEALHAQLAQWRGTRWAHAGVRPNEMRCGVTGDCLFWVHVFKAIGALPAHIVIPDYNSQDALRDDMQRLRLCIEATGQARMEYDGCTPAADVFSFIRPGDVLLFRNGMSGAHCGLIVQLYPTHFVHLSKNGLLEEPLNQAHWLKSLVFVYRLMEENSGAGVPPANHVISGRDARSTTEATA